nr:AlkA N-terminal domain-containing protein [Vibrio eleionomae]
MEQRQLLIKSPLMLDKEQCRQARLSRDARFDGRFFIAVKSTGIFCRPICPANLPKEENVTYYATAAESMAAGYRPCLRCHPDSAPHSNLWRGTETTFSRAMALIDLGALSEGSIAQLADRLGISERYLRQLFTQNLGMSPKKYALYQQLLFAKRLLHTSSMAITDIGFASGFQSTRRFNDAFVKHFRLTPTQIRRSNKHKTATQSVLLSYRGKLAWQEMLDFYRLRAIKGIEVITADSYERTAVLNDSTVWYRVSVTKDAQIKLEFRLDNIRDLRLLVSRVRRQFDLDADTDLIEQHLDAIQPGIVATKGIRIPGIWSRWEAGVRAILGQQVSVKAAIGQLNLLVAAFNQQTSELWNFPTPEQVKDADLSFLRMPNARKDTLARFAVFMNENPECDPRDWLALKGVGPWTVSYAKLRADSEEDCFLDNDLIVRKVMALHPELTKNNVSPWGSYATFHCWRYEGNIVND